MIQCWTADFVRLYEKNQIENITEETGIIFVGASDIKDKENEIEEILCKEMREYKRDIVLPFYGFREVSQFRKIEPVVNVLKYIESGKSLVKDVKVKVSERTAMLLKDVVILMQSLDLLKERGKFLDFLEKLKEENIIKDYGINERDSVLSIHSEKHVMRIFFHSQELIERSLLSLINLTSKKFYEAMIREIEEFKTKKEENEE